MLGPTIEIGLETTIHVTIEEITTGPTKGKIIIGKTTEGETITGKTIEIDTIIEEMTPNKDTGIGVRVEIDQEIIVVIVLEVETETEMDGCHKELELCQMTEKAPGPGLIPE